MALSLEWKARVDLWRKELTNHFYRPLGKVALSGFTTTEQLTPQQALKRRFKAMPPGTAWGAKWEYAWLKGRVTLPAEARRRRIVALLTNQESVVFLNGARAAGLPRRVEGSPSPGVVALTRKGRAGEKFDVLVEAYAGHGPRPCHAGPTPPGRETVPEPPPAQARMIDASFGIWQEDAYQLHIDVETLVQTRNNLEEGLLRVVEIDAGLCDFTLIVDFELPNEAMLETVRAARKRLAPLLACVNGSTAPVLYCFGHAHLDTAWLWPLAHTERKAARTVSNQLDLAAEYPEHKFLMSQPAQYVMLRRRYPELYRRLKKAIQAGQIIPDGGMWVEADTNISGGEALIRQFLHGKRFFKEEFGVESQLLWLPDVFGYSGALPQIMKGCGIKYFSTSKIFWVYHGGDPFPYNNFEWEGIDGTRVLSFIHADYNSHAHPQAAIQRWNGRRQKDGISTFLFPFGFGDGGGGPCRDHLEYIRRLKNFEGAPKMRLAAPAEFFKDLEKRGTPNRYVGELYFQSHRGTYTSQARTKRGNRKSEMALREAEMWGAAAMGAVRFKYPAARMDANWKSVLLNQFHDIIPGSSIHRVYEEAEASYAQVIEDAGQVARAAQAALVRKGSDALTVFNSLNWERSALVELPGDFAGACNAAGQALPTQRIGGKTWAEVVAPSCGWTTIRNHRGPGGGSRGGEGGGVKATATLLENDCLRVEFNEWGEIASIFDKESGRELAAGPCNRFLMFKDVPASWDAWDINTMYELQPVALEGAARMEAVASGPLAGVIRVTRKLNNSQMTQEIWMRRGSRRVDFRTTIDWQESHKMLKVAFAVNVHAGEAIHEIQFGHLRRPTHRSRLFDADRFEVCQQKWSALADEAGGCAVLNDCKYGLNVLEKSINLTLLRSPLAPDMTADQGRQEFTYAFYAWNGSLAASDVVRQAYELNCPVSTVPGDGGEKSVFRTGVPGIVIEAVKPAEDGSGDVIVRLYESLRSRTRCNVATALPVSAAQETTMLEEPQGRMPLKDGAMTLDFAPFEIKTIRLRTAQSPAARIPGVIVESPPP